MTKGVTKKKNRKLRRQARKTLGALFMASAIVVAAVPVPDVSANIEEAPKRVAVVNYTDRNMTAYETIGGKEAPASWQSTIPYVGSDEIIYTTGDGMFQFAFVKPSSEARDEVAVILGANVTNLPDDGKLEIPETVDAYRKYTANTTSTGYVAVSRNDKFLYYKKQVQQTNEYGYKLFRVPSVLGNETIHQYDTRLRLKADGVTYEFFRMETETVNDEVVEVEKTYDAVPVMVDQYFPCYYDSYSEWGDLDDNQLYYWNGPASGPSMGAVQLPYEAETITVLNDKAVLADNLMRNVSIGTISLGVEAEDDIVQAPDEGTVTYQVTVNKGKTLSSEYTEGDTVTITADTAEAGKKFKEWTVVSGNINLINSQAEETTFEMPGEAVEVTATYEDILPAADKYTVTVTKGTGGGEYAEGDTVTITADTAEAGKKFKEWTVVSGNVNLINSQAEETTFEMPGEAVEVAATYEDILPAADKYTVTVTKGTGGGEYAEGDTVTITANTPETGKQFTEWSANNNSVQFADITAETTTFVMPAGNVNITAIYEDIQATPSPSPTVSPIPSAAPSSTPRVEDDPTQTQYFTLATTVDNQRIHDAKVQYIGRQYLVGSDGEWTVAGEVTSANPERGVFAGKGQIVNLIIGDNLLGVGDYAFYGCSGINSVTLGNGLSTVGNGAFANCVNMLQCNMQLHSAIKTIGKDAFMNCRSLTSLVIPVNVEAIGDYCFQGCDGLQSIDLCGGGAKVLLSIIGYKAFENCTNLTSITFPDNFTQSYPLGSDWKDIRDAEEGKIPVSYFNGCTSLQYIKIQNSTLDIIDSGTDESNHDKFSNYDKDKTGCDIEEFIKSVPSIFYFEGPEISEIHNTAKAHSAAFKYLGQDKFEKVVLCPETENDGPHEATFIVNSQNQLIEMQIDPKCGEIEIPSNIGAYGIETISSTGFQNNCFLRKIHIPATVKLIESNAFKGCHNLKDVIFGQPENPELVIQENAFNTQDVAFHNTQCPNKSVAEIPELTFTGSVSPTSVPFQYAMNPSNTINVGAQPRTYITYYSGWPSNLTVKYNPDTDKNELTDYPRYDDLGKYTKESYPYMTNEYVTAASKAVQTYEAYLAGTGGQPTQNEMDIINSALNINLPAGIEAISEGIFSGVNSDNEQIYESVPGEGDDGTTQKPVSANKDIQSITMNTVDTVDPYTFSGCTALSGFYMSGGSKIDDYAFKNCTELQNVNVASTVTELGIRPFAGCDKLTSVNFDGNPNFICEDMVIYGVTDGVKTKLVECLEARGETSGNTKVGPEELAGITEIAQEAFKDCDGIGSVDLTSSAISSIPEQCFAQTDRLYSVLLPETAKSIKQGAFWNSKVSYMEIPSSVTLIETDAFGNVKEEDVVVSNSNNIPIKTVKEIVVDSEGRAEIQNRTSGHSTITFYCTEGNAADTYADNYYYINPTYYRPIITHKVYFWDDLLDEDNPVLIDTQDVVDGEDAVPPEAPVHDGYNFTGWSNYTGISRDTDVYARYALIGATLYHVTFLDWDDTVLDEQDVVAGEGARTPQAPVRDGYVFKGWRPAYDNITKDTTVYAEYEKIDSDDTKFTVTFYNYDDTVISVQKVSSGESAVEPVHPTRTGYTFEGWKPVTWNNVTKDLDIYAQFVPVSAVSPSPVPSGNNGNNNNNNNNNGGASSTASPTPQIIYREPETRKYTVSVSGGSGSGSYAAGSIVAINAYYMGTGQNFDKWTTSTAGVGFANAEASSTTFTMPAANVAITATYKTGSGTTAAQTGTAGNTGGNGNTGGSNNSGTTVEITKPGISNTGLAGATVSGATDNFVVKITEDQAATDAVIAALQARYGDISRIKYLPMDISLYDSTGRTKIADTTGLSVNITIPLPDDLVQYAGNNRAAAVVNGALEDLNTRFTTVDGVPCINFTASHFSPYVIYVDTANLTAGTIDATPKTGDPIHPKWFLAIGMACISLVLFFKRDKNLVKAKAA